MATYRLVKSLKLSGHILFVILLSFTLKLRINHHVKYKKIDRFLPDMKHILIWTPTSSFNASGQTHFIENRCQHINCYLTSNRTLLKETTLFDAIIFNSKDVSLGMYELPKTRSVHQKFIFTSAESAENFPICDKEFDGFFNWTWTYKFDSTIPYSFISVYNTEGDELGTHIQWLPTMKPVDQMTKNQFATKSIAAAWIEDRCETRSNREKFVRELKAELKKYNLVIDVFGACGNKQCKRKTMAPCYWRLRKQYFFYLAFEDSFSLDYVTGVVLHAYKNNVVPIVYGGADYSKFLPPGSYLNGKKLGITQLAKTMNKAIKNITDYYEYFNWKNHYVVQAGKPLDVCALCKKLNNPSWLLHRVCFVKFRKWWHHRYEQLCELEVMQDEYSL